jgi:hypothetical protein
MVRLRRWTYLQKQNAWFLFCYTDPGWGPARGGPAGDVSWRERSYCYYMDRPANLCAVGWYTSATHLASVERARATNPWEMTGVNLALAAVVRRPAPPGV